MSVRVLDPTSPNEPGSIETSTYYVFDQAGAGAVEVTQPLASYDTVKNAQNVN